MGREADRLEPLATSYNTYGVYLRCGNNARITTTMVICKGPRLPRFIIIIIFFPLTKIRRDVGE